MELLRSTPGIVRAASFRPSRSSTEKSSPGQRATRTSQSPRPLSNVAPIRAPTIAMVRVRSGAHTAWYGTAASTIFPPLLLRFVQAAAAALDQFPRPPTHLHRSVHTPACSSTNRRHLEQADNQDAHSYLGHHLAMFAQFVCRFASLFGALLGQLVRSRHIYSPLSSLAHSCLVRFVYPLHPSAHIFLPFFLCSCSQALFFSVGAICHGPSLPEQNR